MKNKLTSETKRGINLLDKYAVFIKIQKIGGNHYEEKKYYYDSFYLDTGIDDTQYGGRGENKAQTDNREEDHDSGQTYKLQLKGVAGKSNVKWKSSKKTVLSIVKKKGNTVTLKAKKKRLAVVTAVYKTKQYKCRITVKEKTAADNPALSSKNVTLYYLSDTYRNYIKYDRSHIKEYCFLVSDTKKKVKEWKIVGKGADYFSITNYKLLQMEWEPAYIEPCVIAKVTAILENGRRLTAIVTGYSELNIYIDTVFTNFEKQFITSSMTEKEKAMRLLGIV